MAHVYSVSMANQSIGINPTLVIIHSAVAGSRGSLLQVQRVWVNQIGTEVSEQLGVIIGHKVAPFGTYSATAPAAHTLGGTASGIVGGTAGAAGTAGTDSSAAGAGAVTTIIEQGFNNLLGFEWLPNPKERLMLPPDTAIVINMPEPAPTVGSGWCAGITFLELK